VCSLGLLLHQRGVRRSGQNAQETDQVSTNPNVSMRQSRVQRATRDIRKETRK